MQGSWLSQVICRPFKLLCKYCKILLMVAMCSFKYAEKDDVLVNCCCPGWVRTSMTSEKAALSPNAGAETPAFLALLPAGSPSGEFWRDKKSLTDTPSAQSGRF